MSNIRIFAGLACHFIVCTIVSVQAQDQPTQVEINPRNLTITDQKASFQDHLGRPSLRLFRGIAYARDLDLQNGTVEADLAATKDGAFLGMIFRVQSNSEYEVVFFRPGGSGTEEAIQYTPAFQGSNVWQIYTGKGAVGTMDFPPDQWIHIKIVVAGLTAKLYVNNQPEPALTIPDLKQGYSKGSIGFWANGGGGYFSNLSYTRDQAAYAAEVKHEYLPGMLTDWEISDAFDVAQQNPEVLPDLKKLKWERVQAETPGMVVLNRYRRCPLVFPGFDGVPLRTAAEPMKAVAGAKVVFARTTIVSDRDQIKRMSFGYSDNAVIYLNSTPIFSGKNASGFREPSSLGYMNVNNDAVFLPLHKGKNELVLAVSDYFGGWGFICRIDDTAKTPE